MATEEHSRILQAAAEGRLPGEISESSEYPVAIVKELVSAGYLEAADASSDDGETYLEPRITQSGREYLQRLRSEDHKASPNAPAQVSKNLAGWVFTVLGAVVAGLILYWLVGN